MKTISQQYINKKLLQDEVIKSLAQIRKLRLLLVEETLRLATHELRIQLHNDAMQSIKTKVPNYDELIKFSHMDIHE